MTILIIALIIALSAIAVALYTAIKLYLKIKNADHITFRKDGHSVTISPGDKNASKKLLSL